MTQACPLSTETLIAYWLGELSIAEADQVEQHYFACASCAGRLESITRLGAGVARVVQRGEVNASVTQKFIDHAVARGLSIRDYHLSPGHAIACTAAPLDDFVVLHLALTAVDFGAIDAVDVAVEWTHADTGTRQEHVVKSVSLDRTLGEIVLLHSGERIRELPKSDWQMQAILHGRDGDTRVGPYLLNHTPWEQLPHP